MSRRQRLQSSVLAWLALALCSCMMGTIGAKTASAADHPVDSVTPYSVTLRWVPPKDEHILEVGDLATLLIDVETPPDHELLPIPRTGLDGLRLISLSPAPIERGPRVWRHRRHIQVQALAAGEGVWPEMTLEIEDTEGERHRLIAPEQRRSILSSLSRHPARERPFGLRHPARRRALPTLMLALALTLGAALVAWVGLRRRAAQANPSRAADANPGPASPQPAADSRSRADAQLARARALLERDPREASNVGAALLRDFMAERFGAALRATTTAELQRITPPEDARAHWQPFVHLLGLYDADRFQDHTRDPSERTRVERVARCLDETERFLAAIDPSRRAGTSLRSDTPAALEPEPRG